MSNILLLGESIKLLGSHRIVHWPLVLLFVKYSKYLVFADVVKVFLETVATTLDLLLFDDAHVEWLYTFGILDELFDSFFGIFFDIVVDFSSFSISHVIWLDVGNVDWFTLFLDSLLLLVV